MQKMTVTPSAARKIVELGASPSEVATSDPAIVPEP